MKRKQANLRDGSEWIDHEDCIVGDEEGIRNLMRACEEALAKGEFFSSELGDYVGVKKLPSDWFKQPKDSNKTILANQILGCVLLMIAALIFFGAYTVIKWFV
ncbi:hypothetical protein [Kangiella sp. HZ709]|uniref:hypothetical protein n=1 Tax=Kangiella sp. HZ709 TaxID=2666328 RepID=UPI0012AF58EE|nr:hypothetical protein [Kangiella sp. HZ709]MRX28528.1 hypothetical protein [Kangiella sp. HZ709]